MNSPTGWASLPVLGVFWVRSGILIRCHNSFYSCPQLPTVYILPLKCPFSGQPACHFTRLPGSKLRGHFSSWRTKRRMQKGRAECPLARHRARTVVGPIAPLTDVLLNSGVQISLGMLIPILGILWNMMFYRYPMVNNLVLQTRPLPSQVLFINLVIPLLGFSQSAIHPCTPKQKIDMVWCTI